MGEMTRLGYEFGFVPPSDFEELRPLLVECCECFRELYGQYGMEVQCSSQRETYNIIKALTKAWEKGRLPLACAMRRTTDKKMVACALIDDSNGYSENAVCMEYVFVRPEHRGRRIGTELVRRVMREAAMRFPNEKVVLNCLENNLVAKRLYARLGLLEKPYEVWYDATDASRRIMAEMDKGL